MPQRQDGAGVQWAAGGGFAIIPDWLLREDISDRAIRLWCVLARHADRNGSAYPKKRTLGDELGCSESSVVRATKELQLVGAIEVLERKRPNGGATSNLYVLHPERVDPRVNPGVDPRVDPRTNERTTTNDMATETKVSVAPSRQKAVAKRTPNLPFDALVQACPGTDPKADGGRVAKALKEIRQRCEAEAQASDPRGDPARAILAADEQGDPRDNQALAAEVVRRAVLYRERWPGIELTPTALSKNWTLVATDKPGGGVTTEEILRMAKGDL